MNEESNDARETAAETAPPRILIAEDDLEMRDLLAWSLRRRGYDVTACADGDSLLRRTASSTDDLIISDIRMPGLSGVDVLKRLRQRDRTTPVVLITAFPQTEMRVEACELGVSAFFSKPFEIEALCDCVDSIVNPDLTSG